MRPRSGYVLLLPVAVAVTLAAYFVLSMAAPPAPPSPPPLEMASCLDDPSPQLVAFLSTPAADILFRFVYDNVFRQDPARGYRYTTKHERSGMTLKEWSTGTIPVVPEPISLACVVGVDRPRPDQYRAVMKVNGTFYLSFVLREGRWLVDYFLPLPHIVAPMAA